jgi:hypothetical protein
VNIIGNGNGRGGHGVQYGDSLAPYGQIANNQDTRSSR